MDAFSHVQASPPQPKQHPARASTILLGTYSVIMLQVHRSILHRSASDKIQVAMEENRERQAAELTLLTTMYPSEFSWRSNPAPDLETPAITSDPNFTLTIHRTCPFARRQDYNTG